MSTISILVVSNVAPAALSHELIIRSIKRGIAYLFLKMGDDWTCFSPYMWFLPTRKSVMYTGERGTPKHKISESDASAK